MKLLTATPRSSQKPDGYMLATWRALATLAIMMMLAIPLQNVSAQDASGLTNVRIRMVNGSSIRATIDSIDASGNIVGSAILNGIKLDQITSIDTGRQVSNSVEESFVAFKFGSRQNFETVSISQEKIQLEIGGSSRSFPLEMVETIIFFPSDTVTRAIDGRTTDSDSVVVRTSSGEKIVRGLVEAIDTTHVVLNYSGKSRRISLEKVSAVVMAKLHVETVDGTGTTIHLNDGSKFVGVIDSLDKQRIDLRLSSANRLEIPCGEIQRIAIQTDRVAYLSDLSPLSFEEQTQFSAARSWQRDRSLMGNPIQLQFKTNRKTVAFDKGIGTRSYTAIAFANDGFDTFHAVVGIDVETRGHGDCEMVVSGDGIRLWSSRVQASDDPQTIKLDVKGIKEITLTVFPGEKFDLADHANWADARFTKN